MRSESILRCRVDVVDADGAADRVIEAARARSGLQVVTLGTEMVVYAQNDRRYRDVVNACGLSVCDTVGLLKVLQARGATLNDRVTGVELIDHICARAVREGLSIFLLGGAEGVATTAAQTLAARFPGLRIAGTRNGYFTDDESRAVAASIRETGAHVLFAGLGFPRQEFWLNEHLHTTGCGAGLGVGGSFDVLSGRVERAPERWRRLNLEWLYRLVREPKRWRRQLALPQFVLLVAADGVRTRFARGKS